MSKPSRPFARLSTLAAGMCLSLSAYGLDLNSAKSQGLVCEQPDGYLRALSGEAGALVSKVNRDRSAAYANIAKKNGVDVREVGILTARKLSPKCR